MAAGSPPVPFQGMLAVSYRGTLGASSWNVDHGFITNGDEFFPDPDFDILLGELFAIFAAHIVGPFCHQEMHFHEVWGHMFSADGSRLRHRKAGMAIGSLTGPLAPAQCATLISWDIRDPGPGRHACSYIPGVAIESLVDEGHFTDEHIAECDRHVAEYIRLVNQVTAGVVDHVRFCILSRVQSKQYRPVVLGEPVTGGATRRRLATQRRRLDREAG